MVTYYIAQINKTISGKFASNCGSINEPCLVGSLDGKQVIVKVAGKRDLEAAYKNYLADCKKQAEDYKDTFDYKHDMFNEMMSSEQKDGCK